MGKKIMILNGSPRPKGNTAMLIDEFTAGAESSGHTVTRFNLQKMAIKPCIGCCKGGKDPESPCTQKDDMDEIYRAFKEADIIALASPLYFWGITGQLKIAIDRLFAAMEHPDGYVVPHKDCILLMAAGSDSEENWQPATDYYSAVVSRLEWKDLGSVLAGGVMDVGDIKGKPSLVEARNFGASIS